MTKKDPSCEVARCVWVNPVLMICQGELDRCERSTFKDVEVSDNKCARMKPYCGHDTLFFFSFSLSPTDMDITM